MIDEVKSVLANLWDLKADEIPNDCKLGQFHKWDSLSHIQIMLELENSLDLKLNADNIQALNSLEKIVSELTKKSRNE
jgi:acyl carrier protein